jgi:nicotinamidase/pyrazinamidase
MKALLIVDLQNDFVPGGTLPVPRGDEIVSVVNALQPQFDCIVATQDWHPPNHGSFAAHHPGKNPGDRILLDGIEQVLWPVHCVQYTPGADFVPGFDRRRIARVFQKGIDPRIDSYSAFYDNAHRRSTGLAEWLHRAGVTEIQICGLATDYCVRWTALDAVAEGFRTRVLLPACRGIDLRPGDIPRALEEMRAAGVTIL